MTEILGIDPGPDGFAWALFDTVSKDILGWGEIVLYEGELHHNLKDIDWQAVAIERVSPYSVNSNSNALCKTSETIGILRQLWIDKQVILIYRREVSSALTGRNNSGNTKINLVMKRLVPSLNRQQKGLNSHTRAACAVAYVAVGRIKP